MKLFLCEKPSQAKDIARVIGAHQRRDNFSRKWRSGRLGKRSSAGAG